MVAQLDHSFPKVPQSSSMTANQQQTAAAVLGRAFAKDAFMAYVLPDADSRIQNLTQIFLPMIRISLRYGGVETSPGNGGVLAWVPTKVFSGPLKILEIIRSGMVWLPASIGVSSVKRLIAHDHACEAALIHHAPQDAAYIWSVGVSPDQTGKGLGKQMIQAALRDMRQQGYKACWLRTENPNNVGLYEYLGFQQVHIETPASSGMKSWLMVQDL